MATTLKGMTWSHPRGYDPMVTTAKIWQERTGTEIVWEKRSLQDFESFPVEELARAFDLIVIDHPHVGQVTAESCLLPLDIPGREAETKALASASVGASFASYQWQGRQWALPIDAAAQVMSYRADKLAKPPRTWSEIMELAEAGRVALPMRNPHSLMCFFTLCANLGSPCNSGGPGRLADPETGTHAMELLARLAERLDPSVFEMDPIAAFEAMAGNDPAWHVVPLAYGYVSYAIEGFRANRLTFTDIPETVGLGPVGSTLGGTGIAVSAFSKHPEDAIAYAYWVASSEVQCGPFAAAGGQPGHAAVWEDGAVNKAAGNFYRGTRATLEACYVRPRHDGYMDFQDAAARRINEGFRNSDHPRDIVDALEHIFSESFRNRNQRR